MKKIRTVMLVIGAAAALAFLANPRQNWADVQQGFRENFDPAARR